MVGAGLFFAAPRQDKPPSQQSFRRGRDLSDDVARRARELGEQVQEQLPAARTYASEQFDV